MKRTVFFVSDSTGITAETLGHALLTQFDELEFDRVTIPFVVDTDRARDVVTQVDAAYAEEGVRPIVFSTLTDAVVREELARSRGLVFDLFHAFIRSLEKELNTDSSHATGRFHGLTDPQSYDGRIEAVDFAIDHDDGASVRHYSEADLIFVGVSRTGKTPTSVYLAMQFGIRTANYPLTEDDLGSRTLPRPLLEHREHLFGLTIDPERLRQIRASRRPGSRYCSLAQCRKEVREAEALFESAGVDFLDTSNHSIEEIASQVLVRTGLRRRAF